MQPKRKHVDLTDSVQLCMVTPIGADVVPLRKALLERRKEEVRALYNTKSVPIKEQRDQARKVINNVYHQEMMPVGPNTGAPEVPVVYKLLAHDFESGREGRAIAGPVSLAPRTKPSMGQPDVATQTLIGGSNEQPEPPQRAEPAMEDILSSARQLRTQKGSRGLATVDQASGHEVRSVAVGANPSDIVRATMKSTSKPLAASATLPQPQWKAHRTVQTNTDASGRVALENLDLLTRAPPKMGVTTLNLQRGHASNLEDHVPGSRSGARHSHRPRDTLFIF